MKKIIFAFAVLICFSFSTTTRTQICFCDGTIYPGDKFFFTETDNDTMLLLNRQKLVSYMRLSDSSYQGCSGFAQVWIDQ